MPCITVSALASNIEILSTSYHVWGETQGIFAQYYHPPEGGVIVTHTDWIKSNYDVSSSDGSAVSGQATVVDYARGSASGTIDAFTGIIESSAEGEHFSGNIGWFSNSYLDVIWEFKTLTSVLDIAASGIYWGIEAAEMPLYSLTDTDTGQILFSSIIFPRELDYKFDVKVSIDPSHTFQYRIHNEALCGGAWYYGSSFTSSVIATVVPEPPTMVLLGLGLMGFAGIRRKFMQ